MVVMATFLGGFLLLLLLLCSSCIVDVLVGLGCWGAGGLELVLHPGLKEASVDNF